MHTVSTDLFLRCTTCVDIFACLGHIILAIELRRQTHEFNVRIIVSKFLVLTIEVQHITTELIRVRVASRCTVVSSCTAVQARQLESYDTYLSCRYLSVQCFDECLGGID